MSSSESQSRAEEFRARLHAIAASYLAGREPLEPAATRFARVWDEWVQASGVGRDIAWFWPKPSTDERKRLEVLLAAAFAKRG
jgi:hypothetical protein